MVFWAKPSKIRMRCPPSCLVRIGEVNPILTLTRIIQFLGLGALLWARTAHVRRGEIIVVVIRIHADTCIWLLSIVRVDFARIAEPVGSPVVGIYT